jgi:hypothetical protein
MAILEALLPKLERLAIADGPKAMIYKEGLENGDIKSQLAARRIKFTLHFESFWVKG